MFNLSRESVEPATKVNLSERITEEAPLLPEQETQIVGLLLFSEQANSVWTRLSRRDSNFEEIFWVCRSTRCLKMRDHYELSPEHRETDIKKMREVANRWWDLAIHYADSSPRYFRYSPWFWEMSTFKLRRKYGENIPIGEIEKLVREESFPIHIAPYANCDWLQNTVAETNDVIPVTSRSGVHRFDIRVFIARVGWIFKSRYGEYLYDNLSILTQLMFGLELSVNQVRSILRTIPADFQPMSFELP